MLNPPLLIDHPVGADDDAPTVVLAHGAGAGMDSPFMAAMARNLATVGLRVVRFEFPYMRARRADGRRRPPDRLPRLIDCWMAVIAGLNDQGSRPGDLVIGGKSLGGRVAGLIADDVGARGLVCLGYPFHAPKKPATEARVAHLATLATPTLIVQGTRDPFGAPAEVAGYALSPAVRLAWIEDGDHSLKPRKASGRTEAGTLDTATTAVAAFVAGLAIDPSERPPTPPRPRPSGR